MPENHRILTKSKKEKQFKLRNYKFSMNILPIYRKTVGVMENTENFQSYNKDFGKI